MNSASKLEPEPPQGTVPHKIKLNIKVEIGSDPNRGGNTLRKSISEDQAQMKAPVNRC